MKTLRQMNPDITVATSTYVMNDKMPVLNVSCDEDDEDENGCIFQFHCGNGDYNMEKMLLVKLKTILDSDETLNNLTLAIGEEVQRKSVGDNWIKTT